MYVSFLACCELVLQRMATMSDDQQLYEAFLNTRQPTMLLIVIPVNVSLIFHDYHVKRSMRHGRHHR